jgi:CRP-like cAMP-binding protein
MVTLAAKALDSFFRQYPLVTAPAGSVFIRENEAFTSVRYIVSGYVRLYVNAACGRELSFHLYGPGMHFPLMLGYCGRHSKFVFEALTPVTLREAPLPQFTDYLRSQPDVMFEVTKRAAGLVFTLLGKLETVMTAPSYQNVVAILLMFSEIFQRENADGQVRIPMSHQALSTWVNMTRETVSRNIELLERKGVLRCRNQCIIVTDRQALERELALT